ncbi:MAG: hypothetical protein WAU65_02525 [Candidatus Nanoarchaeia archaeon]
MKKLTLILIIAAVVVLLGLGAYLLFANKAGTYSQPNSGNAINDSQYQIPVNSGSQGSNQNISQFSGLNLTPVQSQADTVPGSADDIPLS